VKRIVERLDGSITLENIAGRGCSGLRVTVRFPAAVIDHAT
jgi:signal transduction histidine kinase